MKYLKKIFLFEAASGLTPSDLMNMYFAKNKENRERQRRGY
jgi:hypothetical protein